MLELQYKSTGEVYQEQTCFTSFWEVKKQQGHTLHDHHRDENHVEAPLRSPGRTITVVFRGSFYGLQNKE